MLGFAHCSQGIPCHLLSTRLSIGNNLRGICNGLLQPGLGLVHPGLGVIQDLIPLKLRFA